MRGCVAAVRYIYTKIASFQLYYFYIPTKFEDIAAKRSASHVFELCVVGCVNVRVWDGQCLWTTLLLLILSARRVS